MRAERGPATGLFPLYYGYPLKTEAGGGGCLCDGCFRPALFLVG